MRIERATYGAVGEEHGLLASSLHTSQLPPQLAGRTDRPPGILEPGIRWAPLIGCAPMGPWWACWRSVEDPRPRRGGMVRTQVALAPVDALGELPDLRPLFALLDVDEPQASPATLVAEPPAQPKLPASYHELVARLIAGVNPVVVPDVDVLPDLVCALWPRLWPRARRNFAARVLFDPDVGSVRTRWWIVATPAAYAKNWPREHRIPLQSASQARAGMAMGWFLGEPQPAFARMMGLVELSDSFESLRAIERLVALEPALARDDAADDTLVFLRQIVELTRASGGSRELVRRATGALVRQLPQAGVEVILGLANVDDEALTDVAAAVSAWVERSLPTAPDHDAVRLLQRLAQGRSAPWWLASVGAGVDAGLASPGSAWIVAMFRWWARAPQLAAINERLPAGSPVEDALLAALPADCPEALGATLRGLARARGWSRLHGSVLAATHEPRDACAEQRGFTPDAAPGLRELCKRWPAPTRVEIAVASPCPVVVEAAADGIHEDRRLLAGVDPAIHGWRLVWMAVARRCDPWAGIAAPLASFYTLVDKMLDGEADARELVELLLPSARAHLLGHPERAGRWPRLPAPMRATLLLRTADAWVQALVAGAPEDVPEAPLAATIRERMEGALGPRITGATLVRLLNAVTPEDDRQALRLFRKLQRPLALDAAASLGRRIRENAWKDIAQELAADRGRHPNDLDPLLTQCASQLTVWQRFWLGTLGCAEAGGEALLHAFMQECFDHDGLRRWIELGTDGKKIAAALPGSGSSLEEYVAAAVRELGRRGMIDDDFFDRLADEFPRRADAVREIRRRFPRDA